MPQIGSPVADLDYRVHDVPVFRGYSASEMAYVSLELANDS
jgi:hypothetical protein